MVIFANRFTGSLFIRHAFLPQKSNPNNGHDRDRCGRCKVIPPLIRNSPDGWLPLLAGIEVEERHAEDRLVRIQLCPVNDGGVAYADECRWQEKHCKKGYRPHCCAVVLCRPRNLHRNLCIILRNGVEGLVSRLARILFPSNPFIAHQRDLVLQPLHVRHRAALETVQHLQLETKLVPRFIVLACIRQVLAGEGALLQNHGFHCFDGYVKCLCRMCCVANKIVEAMIVGVWSRKRCCPDLLRGINVIYLTSDGVERTGIREATGSRPNRAHPKAQSAQLEHQ